MQYAKYWITFNYRNKLMILSIFSAAFSLPILLQLSFYVFYVDMLDLG